MKLSKLLPFLRPTIGLKNQENREAWLKQTLCGIPAGSRILDAGAGTQQYRKFCEHLDYVSQDFAEYDGKGDEKGLQMGSFDYGKLDLISDITSIPKPDSFFDAIMCVEVLEHIPEPSKAITEFGRLLKPGGLLIITAPFNSLTHFAPYHYCTGFNRYWYEQHLISNGLIITEIIPNGNYFGYIGQELYRVRTVAKKYAADHPKIMESIALFLIQRMLLRFSLGDTGSSESLCFGYHVLANKIIE